MKKYHLILTIRIEVQSGLSLFEAIKELEAETIYSIASTENVCVLDTEILKSELP